MSDRQQIIVASLTAVLVKLSLHFLCVFVCSWATKFRTSLILVERFFWQVRSHICCSDGQLLIVNKKGNKCSLNSISKYHSTRFIEAKEWFTILKPNVQKNTRTSLILFHQTTVVLIGGLLDALPISTNNFFIQYLHLLEKACSKYTFFVTVCTV